MCDTAIHMILPKIRNEELEYIKYANFLVALMARKQNAVNVSHLPIEMTMDISTICHLHCPLCGLGNKSIRRKHQFIAESDYKNFIKLFADTSFVTWLFSAGEPLLHPHAADLISMLKPYEAFPIVSTNLNIKLTTEKTDALLQSGLGVICASLDGATEESYVKYRVDGSFNLVIDNLKLLIDRKKELGLELPYIEWRFLLFRHNQHEIELAKKSATELGIDLLEFSPGFAPNETFYNGEDSILKHNLAISPDTFSLGAVYEQGKLRNDTLLRQLLTKLPDVVEMPTLSEVKHKGCDWLYYSAMIYPDGKVGPCCVLINDEDDFYVISKNDTNFKTIWNSEKYLKTRDAFAKGLIPDTACAHCYLPVAKDWQFNQRIRAALHNAPDWVLYILADNIDTFFIPFDREMLFPAELACLMMLQKKCIKQEYVEIIKNLEKISVKHPNNCQSAKYIASFIKA